MNPAHQHFKASRAAIPLRSVHHDVFYMPAKMPAAQELVLPASTRSLVISRRARQTRKASRERVAENSLATSTVGALPRTGEHARCAPQREVWLSRQSCSPPRPPPPPCSSTCCQPRTDTHGQTGRQGPEPSGLSARQRRPRRLALGHSPVAHLLEDFHPPIPCQRRGLGQLRTSAGQKAAKEGARRGRAAAEEEPVPAEPRSPCQSR